MNRLEREASARQTLDIVEKGLYAVNDIEVNIADSIGHSIGNTVLYSPEALTVILEKTEKITFSDKATVVTLTTQTVLEALRETTNEGLTGCLNFASAKNPGGCFLSGTLAQEESLAGASSLYHSLIKCMKMYEYNRSLKTNLYSDYMIYSPGVVFIKDDEGCLLDKPYMADVLTSPAVNVGAIKRQNPEAEELALVEQTMLARMDKVLAVFAMHNVENLVLGAWGCGVFQNNPDDIARYFAGFLIGNGKYAKCFRKVIFSVCDQSKKQEVIKAFQKVFVAEDNLVT